MIGRRDTSAAASLLCLLSLLACARASPPEGARRPPTSTTTAARWTSLLAGARVDQLGPEHAVVQRDVALTQILPPEPTVVALFATYCPPCLEEMPVLDALAAQGQRVLGLSMDAGNEVQLTALLDERPVRYPVALLTASSVRDFGLALGGLPCTFVLARGRRVRHVLAGPLAEGELPSLLHQP